MRRNIIHATLVVVIAAIFVGCAAISTVALSATGTASGSVGGEVIKRKFLGDDIASKTPETTCVIPDPRPHPLPSNAEIEKMRGITFWGSDNREAARIDGRIDNNYTIPIYIKKIRGAKEQWPWRIMDACERLPDDVYEGDVYIVKTLDGRPLAEFTFRAPKKLGR